MTNEERPIEELFFESGRGKYEVTKIAIDWIKLKKEEDDYRKLSQPDLLDRAVREVINDKVTYDKIEEIKKKKETLKEEKQEGNVSAN